MAADNKKVIAEKRPDTVFHFLTGVVVRIPR
jgi:hypothetical protein